MTRHERDWEEDDRGGVIIGMMLCAISGAIVGCIAGALGATLYIAWWL